MMTYQEFKDALTEEERHIVRHYEQVVAVPEVLQVLEIGSGWGIFSRVSLEAGKQFVTIDKTGGYGRPEFLKNTAGFEGKFEQIEEDSQKYLPGREGAWDNRFDVIFVDGDHGQKGAAKDLTWAWRFLRPGGILLVDDVFHKSNWDKLPDGGFNFGVSVALWGFLQAHRSEMPWDGALIRMVGHGLVSIKKKI